MLDQEGLHRRALRGTASLSEVHAARVPQGRPSRCNSEEREQRNPGRGAQREHAQNKFSQRVSRKEIHGNVVGRVLVAVVMEARLR